MDDALLIEMLNTFLSNDKYRLYNVDMAKRLGGVEYAVILNDMLDQFKYLKSQDQLLNHEKHGNDLMYYTKDQCYDRCAINKDRFETAIKKFVELDFIRVFRFGLPCKNYYSFNHLKIAQWLFYKNVSRKRDSSNCMEETLQPDGGNPPTYYTNTNSTDETDSSFSTDQKVRDSDCGNVHDTEKHKDFLDPGGNKRTASKDEIFTKAVQQKKDWKTEEIELAWEILLKYNGIIDDEFAFICGTIKKIRCKEENKTESKKSIKKQQSKVSFTDFLKNKTDVPNV